MIKFVSRIALSSALAAAVTIGVQPATALDVTRAAAFKNIGRPVTLTELSREFMAQTPYVVNFDFDEHYLDDLARERLNEQAAWIMAHPTVVVSVFGHTDLMGDRDYNIRLGRKRAETVIAYLVSRGVNPDQVVLSETFGEEAPLVNVVAKVRENRRATTYVTGFLLRRVGFTVSFLEA